MNVLPPELQQKVAVYLRPADIKSLRLVNKHFAAIGLRPLFGVLRFSGNDECKKTTEFGRIHEAVDEILSSSFAQNVKKLIFDPAYYREGFWQDYLAYIEAQLNETPDEPYLSDDASDDVSEDDWEAMMERVTQRRLTRANREASSIEAAEAFWAQKISEQDKNRGAITNALVALFRTTQGLDIIEIRPWEFRNFKDLKFSSWHDVDSPQRHSSPTVRFLDIIAQALKTADHHIKHLQVSEVVPELLSNIPATRFVFTGLQHLTLGIMHVDFLLESTQPSLVFTELFKCALPTLTSLEILGGGKWPQLPATGLHSLLKILSTGDGESPLIFPRLEFLHLRSLILSTNPLLQFLSAQPNLARLELGYVYLAAPEFGWSMMAAAIPRKVRRWRAYGKLGYELLPSNLTIYAYNWFKRWDPSGESLPGWEGIEHAPDDHEFRRIGE
ncbi:hypothetical protein F4778DRAFT_726087 [Xylariomycetidae sp. FL2044]|nr:hypothetical protein F4778DRAFT_726087 [Xylariomycetidae sp. FL2044]